MAEDFASNNAGEDIESSSLAPSSSTDSRPRFSNGVPTPPSTPPCIRFNPPLSIQRRVKVHELLRQVSCDFTSPIQSLLEVGCKSSLPIASVDNYIALTPWELLGGGNTPLMQSLLSCEDELPLSILSGIDIDEELFSVGVESAFTTCEYGGDDRWRDLTVSLVHGSFEELTLQTIGPFDAITSCEGIYHLILVFTVYKILTRRTVIEHLDPEPLANFAPVLLGRMTPKVLIVTTPNRDFNSLFEMPFESLDDANGEKPYIWDPHDDPNVAGRRFYRAPHTYAMRHHDHRFEWTRAGFQAWGNAAAEQFNYTVNYHGCGALRDGAEILATRWRVDEALRRQVRSLNIEVSEQEPRLGAEVLLQAFGHCSQVAIFVRNDLVKKAGSVRSSLDELLFTTTIPDMSPIVNNHIRHLRVLPPPLQLVKHHTFEARPQKTYPPKLRDLFEAQGLTMKLLLPVEVQRVWQYNNPREEYKAYDYDAVVMLVNIKTLWDSSHDVRRACRFHIPMFEYLMATADEEEFDSSESAAKDGRLIILNTSVPCSKEGAVQNPGRKATVKMELDTIEVYNTPLKRYQSESEDEEEEGEDGTEGTRRQKPPKPAAKTTTPTITVTVEWNVLGKYPAPAKLRYEMPTPKRDNALYLREPVETMYKYDKDVHGLGALEVPSEATDEAKAEDQENASLFVLLTFERPAREEEEHQEFDYKRQSEQTLSAEETTLRESWSEKLWGSDDDAAVGTAGEWDSW
ncbi:Small RNA 2'-O-methyltransferase [Drechslerella dactyloides]|uniref:Small RNA 2'-O-methyltransferase n=1 Tax=Drechslerella dactyloides TaxID=74499 RepID=A0AAD6J1Q4_DREDA|nr:Small RNA 2'-O-methyltransferase [Drechslerella dactyloides]